MAALIRCNAFICRNFVQSISKILSVPNNNGFIKYSNQRYAATAAASKDELFDKVRHRVNINVGISQELFQSIYSSFDGSLTDQDIALLLHVCTNGPFDSPTQKRSELADEVWNKMEQLGITPTVKMYNIKLRVYISNKTRFNPVDELVKLKSLGLNPDRVTYGLLLEEFCQQGNIPGANSVLEAFKTADLLLGISMFNSFITGHLKAGSPEEAHKILDIMRSRALTPDSDSYFRFALHYAEEGDIDSVVKYINQAESESVFLDLSALLELYRTMITSGHSSKTEQLLKIISEKGVYRSMTMQKSCQLVSDGYNDAAFQLYSAIPKNDTEKQQNRDGSFLLKAMIINGQSAEEVMTVADKIAEVNFRAQPYNFALLYAYKADNTDLAVQLLEILKARNLEVKVPHITPAIVSYRKKQNKEGLHKVIRILLELDGASCIDDTVECLHTFGYPALTALGETREEIVKNFKLQIDYNTDIFNEVLILIEDKVIDTVGKTLQELGLPRPARNNVNRLQREILKETAHNSDDLEHYVTDNEPLLVQDQRIVYDIILNPVKDGTGGLFFIDAPGGTGKTFDYEKSWNSIFFLSDLANSYSAALSNVSEKELDSKFFQWLELETLLVKNLGKDVKSFTDVLVYLGQHGLRKEELFSLCGLAVFHLAQTKNWDLVDKIFTEFREKNLKLRMGIKKTKFYSQLPEELKAKCDQLCDGGRFGTPSKKYLSLEQLKAKTTDELEQYQKEHPGANGSRIALLNKALETNDLESIKQKLREFETVNFKLNFSLTLALVRKFTELGDVEAAVQYFHELTKSVSTNYNITIPLSIGVQLVKAGKIKDALEMIRAADSSTFPKRTEDRKLWILNEILENAPTLHDAATLHSEICSTTTLLVDKEPFRVHASYIKRVLKEADDDELLASLRKLHETYRVFPCMEQVLVRFIEKQDVNQLKKVMDLGVSVFGSNLFHLKLAMSFIRCGMPAKANTVLKTPQLQIHERFLVAECQYFLRSKRVDCLESLMKITKDMPFSKAVMLKYLLEGYVAVDDLTKATKVLDDFAESLVILPKETADLLVKAYTSHNLAVPASLQEYQLETPTVIPTAQTSSSDSSSGSDSESSTPQAPGTSSRGGTRAAKKGHAEVTNTEEVKMV